MHCMDACPAWVLQDTPWRGAGGFSKIPELFRVLEPGKHRSGIKKEKTEMNFTHENEIRDLKKYILHDQNICIIILKNIYRMQRYEKRILNHYRRWLKTHHQLREILSVVQYFDNILTWVKTTLKYRWLSFWNNYTSFLATETYLFLNG